MRKIITALAIALSIGAALPGLANNYGQQQQTGAYAAGGSAYWPRGGN